MPRTISVALTLLCLALLPRSGAASVSAPWIIDAEDAAHWIRSESATVLDTRSVVLYRLGHIEGAVRVNWQQFSEADGADRGKLLPADQLQNAIRAVGVSVDRPVVVVGNPPDDWGEDGRVVWMLRYAGHPRVAFVNGGYDALSDTDLPTSILGGKSGTSAFELRPNRDLLATAEDVSQAVGEVANAVLIDTREAREFRGKTPYGEARGGHVPGAKHLHYKELLNEDGRLLSRKMIRRKLAARGVTSDDSIIAYCTGGVRSGWMVAALQWAGFPDVRNYAGSMWEWAAGSPSERPLVTR